jgi:hypothetical protein
MKDYKVLLQAPYIAAVASVFSEFILGTGNFYSEIAREVSEYFGIDSEKIRDVFNAEWRKEGISELKMNEVPKSRVDILYLVIARAFHLTGVQPNPEQKKRWKNFPHVLRKGVSLHHLQKLKVRVKKMSVIWKSEGYAFILIQFSSFFTRPSFSHSVLPSLSPSLLPSFPPSLCPSLPLLTPLPPPSPFTRYLLKYTLFDSLDQDSLLRAITHFYNSLLVTPGDSMALRNLVDLYHRLWFPRMARHQEGATRESGKRKFLDFLWKILLEVWLPSPFPLLFVCTNPPSSLIPTSYALVPPLPFHLPFLFILLVLPFRLKLDRKMERALILYTLMQNIVYHSKNLC